MTLPNQQMSDYWADGSRMWVANQRLMDHVLQPITDAVGAALAPGTGDRVVDIGCGTGTLCELAVAHGAHAVGVDISGPMVEAARSRVPGATFVVADAQEADLAAPIAPQRYTAATSRFGVMFFADPAAAFGNIRRSCDPGARLVFVCWRGVDENPMFRLGTSVLVERMDPPPPVPPPDAPGPTAFADRDRLSGLLGAAGWDGVTIEPLDVVCDYGLDGSDGVEERMTAILGNMIGRAAREQLEPRLGADGWAGVLDDVRAELRRHLVDGTVRFPGATWLVTAHNPM